jgi:hypothetical protein
MRKANVIEKRIRFEEAIFFMVIKNINIFFEGLI